MIELFTLEQLAQVCRAAPPVRLRNYTERLNRAAGEFGIATPRQAAAFLAQLAHESGEFRWTAEIWGPTPQQKRYERDFRRPWPPTDEDIRLRRGNALAYRLGNVEKGDGVRFKGRGLIQVTGRANTAACSMALFPLDPMLLLHRPELLEQPTQACRSAAWFWHSRNCNEWADKGAFLTLTRVINGGLNGLDSRVKYWRRALAALRVDDTATHGGGGDD